MTTTHPNFPIAPLAALALLGALAGCAPVETEESASGDEHESLSDAFAAAEPAIVSAYAGAVNGSIIPFCPGGVPGTVEGMPIVFNRHIWNPSLDVGDFLVTTSDGRRTSPSCVTLRPADETNEDNTVLLVGDFIRRANVTVTSVLVSGALYAEGTTETIRGASLSGLTISGAGVAQVTVSTRVVSATISPRAESEIGATNGCPASTVQVVRATWSGGIRPQGVDVQRAISLFDAAGRAVPFSGVSTEEEADNDNILDICVTSTAIPVRVTVAAGTYAAPNGLLNGSTSVPIK